MGRLLLAYGAYIVNQSREALENANSYPVMTVNGVYDFTVWVI